MLSSALLLAEVLPPILSPTAFKHLVTSKGWSYADLAEKWRVTPQRISQIASDPERPPWFDDAIRGLPALRRAQHAALRSQRLAKRRQSPSAKQPTDLGRGYRYQGTYLIGSIFIATRYIGELATEGARGRVAAIRDTGDGESYCVDFGEGLSDWFTPGDMDEFLAYTGQEDNE